MSATTQYLKPRPASLIFRDLTAFSSPQVRATPSPFEATRYHSLAVVPDTVDEAVLEITARADDDGSIQGLSHRSLPLHSVQFHPESVLTAGGHAMLAHFLELAEGRDGTGADERARGLAPLLSSGVSR